jgi:dTDP-4-amino-4,6-dideoxygalactose transaminase
MADMVSLREIADRYNLYLIEDAAQAHGASLNGKPAGSWGDLACFSFYPGKNLGAYGEAGAITTDNQALAERLRVLRNHGSETKYKHIELGFNSRLDELQAVVLRAKLPYINRWNEGRRKIARQYDRLLTGSGLVTPFVAPGSVSAYHHYAVTSGNRDALLDWLQANGIGAGIHYPLPIHLQPAGMRYGYAPGSLPVTEKYTASTLSLPIYAEMTDEQVNYIVAKVFEFKELKEKPRIKDSLVTMK